MNAPHNTRKPGDLDLHFGTQGQLFFPLDTDNGQSKRLSDGRILSVCNGLEADLITVLRYLQDGAPDTSFGDEGVVRIRLQEWDMFELLQLRVLPDDSALVYGALGVLGTHNTFVCKLLPNGELDRSFGVNGFNIFGLGDRSNLITALEPLDNGKVIACVVSERNDPYFYGTYLALLDNGILDPEFGDNGLGYVEASSHPLRQLAVTANGGYLLAGHSADFSKAVVRQYHADGNPDLAFGQNGEAALPLPPGQAEIFQVKVRADGKIIGVGGASVGLGAHTLVARLNADGSLDSTFNNGEPKIMVFQGHETLATCAALLPDDKLLVAGLTYDQSDVILMRMEANGNLDMNFGIRGQVVSNLGGQDMCEVVELQDDGKILASGQRGRESPTKQMFLARYLG
ncbi:hypothetical protein [Pseudomonas putida]|uniref:Delta-60 repeat domain-containing protein n=1 Tax=Pseudomonas putida TaxID=303 RepID=A0A1Q9RB08_PSEPU|nr:hypothetical protein [Pseudomonas putida]OLS64633.1 hypothetical protein PSEMO_03610 [Pseudomonas putida]